ncbi:MAG: hypothetical protein Q3983_03935 [Capnocytophaga sp.]|nr:hypothetical protein [Capnocytophaga sp.]
MSHCTVAVEIANSFIRVGKVTFIAVSLTTPEKDIIPVAAIIPISEGLMRSVFIFLCAI